MSAFFLSVIGICVLGVLVDVIIPTGQTNKYIKGAFSLFTVIAILSPLLEFLGVGEIDLNFSDTITYCADHTFIKSMYVRQVESYEADLERNIADITGQNCSVNVDFSLSRARINFVTVKFQNSVILSEDEHIFIVERTKEFLVSSENISEEIVRVVWT